MPSSIPTSIDQTAGLLRGSGDIAGRSFATSLFLALKLQRPLFLEGEAGVGKTEIAKVLSAALGRDLLRLQCYEGLDVAAAVYEWNYPRQMMAVRLAEAAGNGAQEDLAGDIYTEDYLIRRRCLPHWSRTTRARRFCSSTSWTAPTSRSRLSCWKCCLIIKSPSQSWAR